MIYVLWAEYTDLFKIGFTREDATRRATQIQSFSPLPLRIVAETPGTFRDEKELHSSLAQFRQHGEWFALPEEAVWWLLSQCGVKEQVPA